MQIVQFDKDDAVVSFPGTSEVFVRKFGELLKSEFPEVKCIVTNFDFEDVRSLSHEEWKKLEEVHKSLK